MQDSSCSISLLPERYIWTTFYYSPNWCRPWFGVKLLMWLVLTHLKKKTCRSNEVWLLRPEHKLLCNPPCSLCPHHFLWTKPVAGHFVLKIMPSWGEEGANAMIRRSLANCSLSDFFFPEGALTGPCEPGEIAASVCAFWIKSQDGWARETHTSIKHLIYINCDK